MAVVPMRDILFLMRLSAIPLFEGGVGVGGRLLQMIKVSLRAKSPMKIRKNQLICGLTDGFDCTASTYTEYYP